MKNTLKLILMAAATALFVACGAPADNRPAANANTNTANANAAKPPAAAAPTKDALIALEKRAYEAWKNKDAKFWDTFLAPTFVGYGSSGRMDRAAAIKEYSGTECDVKSFALSDEQMMPLGSDAALISYKVAYDATCRGQKLPAEYWAAGVYVRSGDQWLGAFHAETAVAAPNAGPAKPAAAKPAQKDPPEKAADTSPLTTELMALENKGWEAWKNRDAKTLDEIATRDFLFISSAGRKNKADAIKVWTEPKCDIKSFSLTDPLGMVLSKDAALITYKGNTQGTCDGKPLPPTLWVATIDLKEGDVWKNAAYMDLSP